MAYIKTVKYKGQKSTSTLSGDIRLEEGNGRLVVYNPSTGSETTIVDINGFRINDSSGNELTKLDTEGLTISQNDGIKIVRVGIDPATGDRGFYLTPPDEDVIQELYNDA